VVARAFRRRSRLPVECHRPRQSPAPGFGEKYWSLSGFPSHSLESGGGHSRFVRVDDEHVLALVEAVHGAHFDAVHGFAANAALVDDVRQLSVLSTDRSGELIHRVRYRGARSLAENGRRGDLRPLIGSGRRVITDCLTCSGLRILKSKESMSVEKIAMLRLPR
jgi:hypothetical protein